MSSTDLAGVDRARLARFRVEHVTEYAHRFANVRRKHGGVGRRREVQLVALSGGVGKGVVAFAPAETTLGDGRIRGLGLGLRLVRRSRL